jgi:uncharacterized protein YggU (UPF0235/DUF167 family)
LTASSADELELTETKAGTRLRVRVSPGARAGKILGVHAGALKLSVVAAPERGRANAAVVQLVAESLGVPASAIEVTAGHASRAKSLRVALAAAEVRLRLAKLLA